MITVDVPYPWIFALAFLNLAMLTLWFKERVASMGDFHALLLAIMRIKHFHESDAALEKIMPRIFWCLFVVFVMFALMGAATGVGILKNKWNAPPMTDQDRKEMVRQFEERHKHLPPTKVPVVEDRLTNPVPEAPRE
ncbi:MAG: hypothetical protein JSS02_26325 [Planctomycetes bacterium]|nr:hypothetical protein [Planctomycetota bacterium]